jgi:hypothetical protein
VAQKERLAPVLLMAGTISATVAVIVACSGPSPTGPSGGAAAPSAARPADVWDGTVTTMASPITFPVPGGGGNFPVPGGGGTFPVPGGGGTFPAPAPGGPFPIPGGGGPIGPTPPPTPIPSATPSGSPSPSPSPSGSPSPSTSPSTSPTPSPTATPTPFASPEVFTFTSTTQTTSQTSAPISVSGLPAGRYIHKAVVSVYITGVNVNSFSTFPGISMDFPDQTSGGFAAVVSPDNSRLTGASLGSGCGIGSATTFDPSAATPLESGTPPYSGTFRSFRGSPDLGNGLRDGDAASHNGQWRLTIGNSFGGTYQCWTVQVYVCRDPGALSCPFP